MSRYHAYLKRAVSLLEQYDGEEPFSIDYKNEIAKDKKVGATGRYKKLVTNHPVLAFSFSTSYPECNGVDSRRSR